MGLRGLDCDIKCRALIKLSKFISGDYGLPITFLVLGAVTKGITTYGQWVFLAGVAVIQALLITMLFGIPQNYIKVTLSGSGALSYW